MENNAEALNWVEQWRKQERSSIPSRLFKFISLDCCDGEDTDNSLNESKFSVLAASEIWLSNPESFNDPYELKGMILDFDKLQRDGYLPDTIRLFEGVLESMRSDTLVSCLTGNSPNDVAMWANYASNHCGFCVEYEVSDRDKIFRVAYEGDRVPIASLINEFVVKDCIGSGFGSNCGLSEEGHARLYLLSRQFCIKHESWSHENEYRIVLPLLKQCGEGSSFASCIFGLSAKRLYAGLNCSDAHFDRLSGISESLGLGKVERASLSGERYSLFDL